MKLNLTILSGLMFAIVSYGLYQLSYEVQELENDLGSIQHKISDNRESIRILKAEWAYQNRPDVLQELAQKHLSLVLIAPYQVAQAGDLSEIVVSAMAAANVPVPRLKPRKKYSPPVDAPAGHFRLATYTVSEASNE
ncbi:MAG: hypothetical protein COB93_08525 [Sneathiella sp.]|nr:MAG: hypothetical protein COB93_08525 [Sneathiella sp.]